MLRQRQPIKRTPIKQKPVTCKHCGAVDKHHSFQCYTQLKPIKSKPITVKPVEIKKAKPKVKVVSGRSSGKTVDSLMTMSAPKLALKAQSVFNEYIRKRDSKYGRFNCISCKEDKPIEQMNAGHCYSAGNHSYLRFNENNVHGQCIKCNLHLHGNLIPYLENLVEKIGQEEVNKLAIWKNFSQKWDKIQYIGIIQLYRSKLKHDFL